MEISHIILFLFGLNIAGFFCSNYHRNDNTGNNNKEKEKEEEEEA